MSQKRYYEMHDSNPQYVEGPGFRFKTAGPVSAKVIADSYSRKGVEVTVRPVTTN
jgi:hypothetical protein